MDKYELMLVLDATMQQPEKESIVKEVSDAVSKLKAKVINSQLWLDKHKLSFRMKKKNEGTYYLINFEGQRSAIPEIRQWLKINERLLRFLIVRVEA